MIPHPPSPHDSISTRGSVKIGIVPPSPRTIDTGSSGYAEHLQTPEPIPQEPLQHKRTRSQDRPIPDRHAVSLAARSTSEMTHIVEDTLPTPTRGRPRHGSDWSSTISEGGSPRSSSSHQLTPASSTGNLKGFVDKHGSRTPSLQTVERKSSVRSQTQPPLPLKLDHPSKTDTSDGIDVPRQGGRHEDRSVPQSNTLVESPTTTLTHKTQSQELLAAFSDVDATSLRSATSSRSKKNNGWRKPSLNASSRKPSGIAAALATSGLAMANATSQVPSVPAVPGPASKSTSALNGMSSRENTLNSRTRVQHAASSSVHSMPDAGAFSRNISLSRSDFSDGDGFGSSEDESGSDDELDLNEQDIPVTGFAVASNKRNADFHELFPNIPEGDYLIEDYGCALQREILIQGRLYISENHICFHANIFGWITDLSIPIYEIVALEKKMTAFVIPNAIQITTRQAKYTFASFLARDTTHEVITNIWRLARPEDNLELVGSRNGSSRDMASIASVTGETGKTASVEGPNKVTQCSCSKDGGHYHEVALETVLPGTPDKIYNLMFASGFIKDFMKVDQKLTDVQISDWAPISQGSNLLQRNMSYIKPLNNSVGPRQTKCEIHDEAVHCDFEDHVVMLTATKTPDVPSGGVFLVKTRTCLMWASSISTRVIVTTQVEWSGRSFIKGLIEKSAIEGQKVYHSDLDKAIRMYIQEHQSEFIPEGIDPTAVAPVEPITPVAEANGAGLDAAVSDEEARKARERDRNRRGLQWAYDTFDGAYNVAKRSTTGALELIREAWDQSSSTTVLWFVIVLLVFSNLWTLMLVGNREEVGRRKEAKRAEEREKWVQGVVSGVWGELAAERVRPPMPYSVSSAPVNLQTELANIGEALDAMEDRVRSIRERLNGLS
ncbi:hypothetical protein BU15DRAFT_51746 [Melanogaster broomeanus]|nr:hypothetical protein BU15DRAFT_51746 [Melanogaster broomeanus]